MKLLDKRKTRNTQNLLFSHFWWWNEEILFKFKKTRHCRKPKDATASKKNINKLVDERVPESAHAFLFLR